MDAQGAGHLETHTKSQEAVQKKIEALVALNFRVPFGLRQQIKLGAFMRGLTMTELLSAAFEQYFSKNPTFRRPGPPAEEGDTCSQATVNALKK